MGCDIMTVECPMCVRVSSEFGLWISEHAQDFDIRYCFLVPTRAIVGHLREVAKLATFPDDATVAATLLGKMGLAAEAREGEQLLENGDEVSPHLDGTAAEILIGW